MSSGSIGTPGEYIADVVESRVRQAGMGLTDDARDFLRQIVDRGLETDFQAAEDGADQLAERIVQGAVTVAGLTEGDRMDLATLRSIRRWFCPLSPWC